jgi:GNAT superfamily N-acetyltransferase
MIRLATQSDAAAVAGILALLGYQARIDDVRHRLETLETDRDWVFVADRDGVVGVIAVHVIPLLQTAGTVARITALIVAPEARGNGVGRQLVGAARTFARQTGCVRLEVTSGDGHADSPGFYAAVGFRADELRFVMDLANG